jgi:hypothetical protein
MIFLYLDYPDLLRIQRVCKLWQSLIKNIENMKPSLYKKPETIRANHPSSENPHFKEISAAALELATPEYPNILQAIQTGHASYFTSPLPRPRDIESEVETFDDYQHTLWTLNDSIHDSYGLWPVEHWQQPEVQWPQELRDNHCFTCRRFHTTFHWEHMHPILRFLGEYDYICVSGFGSSLVLDVCWRNYDASDMLNALPHLCERLKDSVRIVRQHQLQNDLLCRPACEYFAAVMDQNVITRFAECRFVRSKNGVGSGKVWQPLPAILQLYLG